MLLSPEATRRRRQDRFDESIMTKEDMDRKSHVTKEEWAIMCHQRVRQRQVTVMKTLAKSGKIPYAYEPGTNEFNQFFRDNIVPSLGPHFYESYSLTTRYS